MTTVKTKFMMALVLTLGMLFSSVEASTFINDDSYTTILKNKEEFKHGQYVYVTLKDGSQTAGKIVGKRNSKKYYVNQLDGSHHGVVHKKYIRKMTKEEVTSYKLSHENTKKSN